MSVCFLKFSLWSLRAIKDSLSPLTCRLINPCKPEIGKISKQLLEKIVKVVKDKTKYNHLKNTNDVIKRFGDIPNKKNNHLSN